MATPDPHSILHNQGQIGGFPVQSGVGSEGDRFLVQSEADSEADGQDPSRFICIYKEHLLLPLQ